MGNCTSSDGRRRRRRSTPAVPERSPEDTERRWSDRGPDDDERHGGERRRVLQSMARVGSRVFRQSTVEEDLRLSGQSADGPDWDGEGAADGDAANGDGEKQRRLKEHKASTYEHVHQTVEAGIDAVHRDRRSSREVSGRVGLVNLGNTCFMNSSLQCLSNTVPLTDYFLGYDYRGEINRENFLGTGGQLVGAYAELTKHLWLGAEGAYRPGGFKRDLERFAPQFEGCEQHDAQE